MQAGTLYAEITKVCPVLFIRVGVADDRSTWSFVPAEGATEEQIAAGDDVIATIPVDFQPPPTPTPQVEALYGHENRLRVLEGSPPLTLVEFMSKTKIA